MAGPPQTVHEVHVLQLEKYSKLLVRCELLEEKVANLEATIVRQSGVLFRIVTHIEEQDNGRAPTG